VTWQTLFGVVVNLAEVGIRHLGGLYRGCALRRSRGVGLGGRKIVKTLDGALDGMLFLGDLDSLTEQPGEVSWCL
jgi:hypothetical protein